MNVLIVLLVYHHLMGYAPLAVLHVIYMPIIL